MSHLIHDIRFALRGFSRTPAFTLTAVLTLGIGVAGLSTVFALLNATLLKPLPVDRPGELVSIAMQREGGSGTVSTFSYPQYRMLREELRGLAGIAAFSGTQYALGLDGHEPEMRMGYTVTNEYFELLGVRPAAGRFFTTADAEDAPVVVVSHEFWRTRLNGSAEAIGRTVRLNGQPLTVIGVAPEQFSGTIVVLQSSFWAPAGLVPRLQPGTDIHTVGRYVWLNFVGRLAPGVTRTEAEPLMTNVVRGFADAGIEFERQSSNLAALGAVTLSPLRPIPETAAGAVAGFLGLLLAAALLVLVIAGVNIASMMLARSTARAREMAVRRSLGAPRLRLIVQLMTENMLLFVAGAGVGLLVASWLTGLIPAVAAQAPVPVHLELGLDARVVAFGVGMAALAGALFGLAPALYATEVPSMPLLREGMSSLRGTRLRSAFVVAQLALSIVLLVSAGLLGRALQRALAIDTGFDATNVALASLDLVPFGYDAERGRLYFAELTSRLQARPEIDGAGVSMAQPLGGGSHFRWMRPDGQEEPPQGGLTFNEVDEGYFSTLRVQLLAGRLFGTHDRQGAPLVAVVNEAFVQRYWPGESGVGRRIHEGPTREEERSYEVVGVVATSKYASLMEEPTPMLYLSRAQGRSGVTGVVYARSSAGSAAALQALRSEIRALDADVPLQTAAALQESIELHTLPQRIAALAIGSFGTIGLALALIGIYGLVAFSVAQRTREIGLRIALGAREQNVLGLFLRQGAVLLAGGVGVGLLLAFVTARLLTSLLYGLSPADPLTFVLLPLLLIATAMVAVYLPARRASRVDPMSVLRAE